MLIVVLGKIITIIDKVRVEIKSGWVWSSGGLECGMSWTVDSGHFSRRLKTDLVTGDWLTPILPTDDREETTNHL